MIVLIGKTCSGKTTIANELMKSGFHKIITTTSRGIRENEAQDIDYHFVPNDKFIEKIRNNEFVEWKSYNTVDGVWYYGTTYDELQQADDKSVLIITPRGLKELLDKGYDIISIYIYANNNTIKKRLIDRGDSKDEAERRLLSDNEEFKHAEKLVDRIFYNNSTDNINDVVNKIREYISNRK